MRGVFAVGRLAAQQHADALDQQALGERLLDVVVRAHAQAHQLVHLVILRGEEDHRHLGLAAQALQELHAVHAGHLDIEHGEIYGLLAEAAQRLRAVGIGADGEAFGLQRHLHGGQDVAVVIDQSDGLSHGRRFPSAEKNLSHFKA